MLLFNSFSLSFCSYSWKLIPDTLYTLLYVLQADGSFQRFHFLETLQQFDINALSYDKETPLPTPMPAWQ